MGKSLFKDLIREIKGSLGRFISIMAITAIGAAFFAGVTASSGDMKRSSDNYYDEFYVLEFDSIKARLVDECQRRKIMLRMQGDKFDVYRKEYNEIVNSAMNHPVGCSQTHETGERDNC